MDSFRRDGLTFDVRDAGPPDGEPVVLLHGFPQDSTAWDAMAPQLHQHGLRTLALDLRSRLGSEPAAVAVAGVSNNRPVVIVATNDGVSCF